jgi:hypothetical protein
MCIKSLIPAPHGGPEWKLPGMVSSGELTHRLVEDQTRDIREPADVSGRRGASR